MANDVGSWQVGIADLRQLRALKADAVLLLAARQGTRNALIGVEDRYSEVTVVALKLLVEHLSQAEKVCTDYVSIFPREYQPLITATLLGDEEAENYAKAELTRRQSKRRKTEED